MTPKQLTFVQEYLVDLNATQAAIRAGYSPDTAKMQGSRLLTKDDVQAAIAEAQEQRREKLEITADRVVQEYARYMI
ncbi:terminase small subunit [Hyphomonas sp. UBA4494]|jgi:phage terminase small subunit|uniref:terminase small subunit n=1 Tax=Hyphomonas sp. UBA4494 TaxID=1946631 RepID=UPI0025BAA277|nr:terminase small subunit [Hyphomonas sp. UBA4494]